MDIENENHRIKPIKYIYINIVSRVSDKCLYFITTTAAITTTFSADFNCYS